MSANIKASVDGTQAIIGVGGVDQMTVSNAGVVTANSFVGLNGSSVTATGSATARTLANRFADVTNVLDFGADPTGVVDSTDAIQDALDYAKTTTRCVFIPKGSYVITQIAIPTGLHVYGAGVGGYGSTTTSYIYDTTELIQKSGVNKDAIVFDCPFDIAYRLFHVYLHDFGVLKEGTTDTIGNGISAVQVGTDRNVDGNHCLVNGLAVFERIQVRGFPENGMYFRRGAVPMYLNEIYTIFNKGYGIRIDGTNYVKNIVMRNITGDGNTGRAVVRIASVNPDAQITIDGLYGEFRADCPYGNSSGFLGAQPYGVEVVDFNHNSTVYIANALVSSTLADRGAQSVIFLNNSAQANTPKIVFQGLVMSDLTKPFGTKVTLFDNRGWDSFNSYTIPASVTSGVYSLVDTGNTASVQFSNGHTAFGTGFKKPLVSTDGPQANGTIPSLSLYESDALTDAKGWYINANGGNLYFRTYNDAISNGDIYAQVVRSGYNVLYIELLKQLRLQSLPVFADNTAASSLATGTVYRTATGDLKVKY